MTNPYQYTAAKDALKDKVVLVTGAADGIGKAAATEFGKAGATVVLLDQHVRKLEALYDELLELGAPQPAIYPMKMNKSGYDAFEKMGKVITENFGRLDGLVLNAAAAGSGSSVELSQPQTWVDVMHMNVHVQVAIIQQLLPLMKVTEGSRITFTLDQAAKGFPYLGPYGVSKAAQEGLMQTLAAELEGEVMVNAVAPLPTLSKLRSVFFPGEKEDILQLPEAVGPAFVYAMLEDVKQGDVLAQEG